MPTRSADLSKVQGERYRDQARRPLTAVWVILPLVLLYEVGTHLYFRDTLAATETRVIAFTWLRTALQSVVGQHAWLAPTAAIALPLGWHVFAGHAWRVRPTTLIGVTAEGTIYAVPLLVGAYTLVTLTGTTTPPGLLAGDASAGVVIAAGAGVYEEIVFRLIGLTLACGLLSSLLSPGKAMTVAIAFTSLAFAAYHHVPAAGEAFELVPFLVRTAAGVWLAGIFLVRGLAAAVLCHVAYDVVVLTF